MYKSILFFALFISLLTGCSLSVNAKDSKPGMSTSELHNISGLKFISHEAVKEKRTSLNLTPEKDICIDGNFTLNFDASFSNGLYTFGYIFRIVIDDEVNLDMVSISGQGILNINVIYDQRSLLEFDSAKEVLTFMYEKWIPISLTVDKENDSIIVNVDGNKKSFAQKLKHSSKLKIYFGQSTHSNFYSSDVPTATIRDIRILDNKDKPLYHWVLGKHNGNIVYDEIRKSPAHATNPIWLIDKHFYWEKRVSTIVPHAQLHVATDSDNGKIYFAGGNYLSYYDNSSPTDELKTVPVKAGIPFQSEPTLMAYNSLKDQLIAYDIDAQRFSFFDFTTQSWSMNDTIPLYTKYWHHNSIYIPQENKLVLFGGYGTHHYSSQFSVIDFAGENPVWHSYDLSEKISPRYLSGMTYDGKDHVLITGGYGSHTGSQTESPHNFYDLYKVNIHNGAVDSLYIKEKSQTQESFVFGNSTVLSNDGNTLYAIIYNDKHFASEMRLINIDIKTGESTDYTNPIPYEFADIKSYCTLIHDKNKNELLIAETKLLDDNQTRINIYGLRFPPLLISDIQQEVSGETFVWYIIPIILLAAIPLLFIIIKRRRKKEEESISHPVPPQEDNYEIPQIDSTTGTTDFYNLYRIKKYPSSISLLGGFYVIDKNGKDITGSFTQTVRQLFLIIILETYKNGRGVSSQRLNDIFWFDKDPVSARNNRNVNMHKLRLLLQKVGEVDIAKDNSYWLFNIKESVFCDYSMVLQLFSELENNNEPDIAKVNDLIKLASFGEFLSNTQTEWIDSYKSEFTIRLIELLINISETENVKQNPSLLLRIADTILIHDSLDEDAIRIKCSALYAMGKKNQAKVCYDTFVTEYKKVLNTPPEFKLSDINQ